MRLDRLDLVRYGKFTDRVLDFGPARAGVPDFHLVYGPNEAGKSTLFSAFLDLLFGIERLSTYGFQHSYQTMRVGGVIETAGAKQAVYRVKRNQNALLGPDEQPLPDAFFAASLGAVDRATYQMMFSLDDDSIEKGGESILKSEGELGALLFSASSGLPDSSLVLADLKAKADGFYKPQGRKHRLSELKTELDALKEQKAAIDVNAREFAHLRKNLDMAAERHERELRERAVLRVSLDAARARIESLPLLARLRGLRADLAGIADVPEPPSAWFALLPKMMREDAETTVRLQQVESDIERRLAEIDRIETDDAGGAAAADIRDIERSDLEARYRTAARDMPSRLDERDKVLADLHARLSRLERETEADPASLLLSAAAAARLQDLAQQHSGLNERQTAALSEMEQAEEADREALHALAEFGDAGEPSEFDVQWLADRLRSLRQNDCLLRQQAANRQIGQLEAQLKEKLETLRQGEGDPDAVLSVAVPTEDERAAWKASHASLAERRQRLEERIAEDTTQIAGEQARLDALTQLGGFAADDDARALRQERDSAWSEHERKLDRKTADAFVSVLRRDDDAAAMRLAQSERLAEARGLSLSLAERAARVSTLTEQHATVVAAAANLDATIATAVRECGLPETTGLARLEDWLQSRTGALDIRKLLRAARHELDQAIAAEEKAVESLTVTLEERIGGKRYPTRLDELLAFAERDVAAVQSRQQAQQNAAVAAKRARASLDTRRTAFDSARDAVAVWQQRWSETLSSTWLAATEPPPSPSEIVSILSLLQEIDKLVQRRADLDHRIDGMRKDQLAFQAAVSALSARLDLPGQNADEPLQLFETLRARSGRALEQARLLERLSEENERRRAELQALSEDRERHEAGKREMLELFDCGTLAEVDAAMEAAKARTRLRERIAETEADLCGRLGVAHADDAELALSALDAEELRLDMAALDTRLDESERRAGDLYAERRDAEKTLAEIGGNDAAAHLDERRRTVLADIEERALTCLRLRTGILAGEMALRLYRERHRSAMMQRASLAFSKISGGEYSGLSTQADKGEEFLIANAASGGSKLARDLSKGTRFQLYLSLRMAGYHEIAATRETLPFIADDIMETFDDSRAGHAFGLMADMARVGQVIYLTHHQHLCAIAKQACPEVKIHSL